MAEKKPTTKAHRGFIHIPKRGGGRRRPPRDPFNPFRPRRPRIPRFPFGRGRLGPADEPLDRRGRPIRSPIQGRRRRRDPNRNPLMGIRPFPGMNLPTVEPQPIRRFPQMPNRRADLTPQQRALMERQLRDLANRRRRQRRQRRLPQMTAGLGSLGSSIFNRATRAQRRAKGGMAFKSKDYVNPSNTVDNKKK